MSKLVWDAPGTRLYETGTKKGVLYLPNESGAYNIAVAWNGLTGFSEEPDGGDANDIYADDIKYLSLRATENFKGTITAYTYPDEFAACDGSATLISGVTVGQQPRKPFGFSYVSTLGNDTEFDKHGYKIHLIYGCSVSPSSKDYQTINDSPEAIEFSWELDTIPVNVDANHKPTAHVVIDSTKLSDAQLTAIENVLYGTDPAAATGSSAGTEGTAGRLPLPSEVVSIIQNAPGN